MVGWLFVGSFTFSAVFAILGGDAVIKDFVVGLDLSPLMFLIVTQIIIFILGWPLEWTEIIVIFVPIFLPLLDHFGIDPLFFGLLIALNIQTSFLSPPVAMAPFYLKGVAPKHVSASTTSSPASCRSSSSCCWRWCCSTCSRRSACGCRPISMGAGDNQRGMPAVDAVGRSRVLHNLFIDPKPKRWTVCSPKLFPERSAAYRMSPKRSAGRSVTKTCAESRKHRAVAERVRTRQRNRETRGRVSRHRNWKDEIMKITLLAVLVALAAGSAAMTAPAEAASPAIKGDSGRTYWRDDYYRHDNGRHLGWQKQRRHHEMRLRERRDVRECRIITHRYWRNGRRVSRAGQGLRLILEPRRFGQPASEPTVLAGRSCMGRLPARRPPRPCSSAATAPPRRRGRP